MFHLGQPPVQPFQGKGDGGEQALGVTHRPLRRPSGAFVLIGHGLGGQRPELCGQGVTVGGDLLGSLQTLGGNLRRRGGFGDPLGGPQLGDEPTDTHSDGQTDDQTNEPDNDVRHGTRVAAASDMVDDGRVPPWRTTDDG